MTKLEPKSCPCCGSYDIATGSIAVWRDGVTCQRCGLEMAVRWPDDWPAEITTVRELQRRCLDIAIAAWNKRSNVAPKKCLILEVNQSNEWLKVHSLYLDSIPEEHDETAAAEFTSRLMVALEHDGFAVKRAGDSRRTCNGWHGANKFTWKFGPVGTFDEVSESQGVTIIATIIRVGHDIMKCFG